MSGVRNMWEVYYVYNTLSYTYVQLLLLATTSNFSMHGYRSFKIGNAFVGVNPFFGGGGGGFETGRMEPRDFSSLTSTKSHYVTGPTKFPAVASNPRYATHSGAKSYHLARFRVLTATLLKTQVFWSGMLFH